jgi:hypothetical protein
MSNKRIKIDEIPCAALSEDIKKLNGKSAERLRKSIEALWRVLKQKETK